MLRILFFLVVLTPFSCYAHESNKAFFDVSKAETSIIINAEFPWTIRKALIKFNPQLESATSKNEFLKSFKDYLKKNLILINENDEHFELVSLQEVLKSGHSHQSNYFIEYQGKNLEKVKNTLLFNINEDQKNYHQITNNNIDLKFVTSAKQPLFRLPKNITSAYLYLLLTIPFVLLLFFIRKKNIKELS